MDKGGLLRGKFHFKKLPDGSLDKTKAICTVCKAEFNDHRSSTSLAYHLKAKHPAEITSTGPRQSTLQECGTRGRITKPELNEEQVAHGLKQESLAQDVATRWNSTLEMVKRMQRNTSPLTTTLAQQKSKVAMVTDKLAKLAKLQKLEELLEPSDTDDEEESIEHCLDRYKAEPKMDIEGCPLQWWSKREGAHARLAPIARKYLSTPATTVPCERLFSLSGHIVQQKRASLSPHNVNKLVCLSNWLNVKKD
ncbi:hypothetical protein KUCAC02_030312 [Chaenocephalus aceratus]|uniref:Uncharacterized protein n=1 Tax=Chaenocephalus aceratus TaxID=36190 RepID=A0ACB9XIH0_CHAAC|nr:hypothetical protein KUCAC02_030312 [Chaenocephalus aceratus]